jgi:hypothetical protein
MGRELLAERTRGIASGGRQSAKLVRFARGGLGMANEEDAHAV